MIKQKQRGVRAMGYMEKKDRAQISLLPECVEDYVDEENPVSCFPE